MRFVGIDVIDIQHSSVREHFAYEDVEWMERHIAESESAFLRALPASDRLNKFWMMFALKEASSKILSQMGFFIPHGSFKHFEVNLESKTVFHVGGSILKIESVELTTDWLSAVVSFGATEGVEILSCVRAIPLDVNASDFVREMIRADLKFHKLDGFSCVDGGSFPYLSHQGQRVSSVSFSHSGRFGAVGWIKPVGAA